jgi:hypothetical protein
MNHACNKIADVALRMFATSSLPLSVVWDACTVLVSLELLLLAYRACLRYRNNNEGYFLWCELE